MTLKQAAGQHDPELFFSFPELSFRRNPSKAEFLYPLGRLDALSLAPVTKHGQNGFAAPTKRLF